MKRLGHVKCRCKSPGPLAPLLWPLGIEHDRAPDLFGFGNTFPLLYQPQPLGVTAGDPRAVPSPSAAADNCERRPHTTLACRSHSQTPQRPHRPFLLAAESGPTFRADMCGFLVDRQLAKKGIRLSIWSKPVRLFELDSKCQPLASRYSGASVIEFVWN